MIIGLILWAAPGYSETFFTNKIKSLKEVGMKVLVFTNETSTPDDTCEYIRGFSWSGNRLTKLKNLLTALIHLFFSYKKALALYKLNRASGFSIKENILSLLLSAHILKYKLDWIHFGFIAPTLKRENLATALNAKMAVSLRGYGIAVYPIKNPGCYDLLWKRVDKLHYLSDNLFSLAIKQGFDADKKHQKITPAVDTTLFQPKRNCGFHNPLKITTVARLHWIKGLEYTLEALSIIDKKRINFEYSIIGEGDDYERLKFAAYQLGINEKVRFLGKKSQHEIKEIIGDSDLYVQYSIQEGFCNAVLEAQAIGLLCIVSDGGALPENVLNNKTGWVVPKRNPKALADQIEHVINLPEINRFSISQAAIERVGVQFNLEKQKSEFLQFYE